MPGPASIAGKYPQFGGSLGDPRYGGLDVAPRGGGPTLSADGGMGYNFSGGGGSQGAWQPGVGGWENGRWYDGNHQGGYTSMGQESYNPTGQRSNLASVLAGGQKWPMAGYGTGLEADSYTPAGGMIPVGKGPTMGGGGKPSIGSQYGGGKPRLGYGGGGRTSPFLSNGQPTPAYMAELASMTQNR